jgi:hypothetical protein
LAATSGPSDSDTTGRKTIRGWLVYSSILLILVLLVVAVWPSVASSGVPTSSRPCRPAL